jgi:hypothetical protein
VAELNPEIGWRSETVAEAMLAEIPSRLVPDASGGIESPGQDGEPIPPGDVCSTCPDASYAFRQSFGDGVRIAPNPHLVKLGSSFTPRYGNGRCDGILKELADSLEHPACPCTELDRHITRQTEQTAMNRLDKANLQPEAADPILFRRGMCG